MGKGGRGIVNHLSWEEVKKHSDGAERWLVIENEVYDISKWMKRHPGGAKILGHYAGEDASSPFKAFHNDQDLVRKYLKGLHIGSLRSEDIKHSTMDEDFRELRKTAESMGLFRASFWYYFFNLSHLLILEILAYTVLAYYGTGWIPWLASLAFMITCQSQVAWTQHDFGHISVFGKSKIDHFIHNYLMGFVKGASPHWWNHLHYQHHAKPNVIGKDPDVRLEKVFVVGEKMPLTEAKKEKTMPFDWQHRYFFLIGPPLLFPVYFQIMTYRHAIVRRKYMDLVLMIAMLVKYFYLYLPLLGFGGSLVYYFIFRCGESHWFTWVSQSNHIPMEIDNEQERPWLSLQLTATCDIEKSFFNDWFTGHLNFQIEHHLFPTMPRHNLYKIQPLVKSLCKKHGIPHETKQLWQSFCDIVRSLKYSGELWANAYEQFHEHAH